MTGSRHAKFLRPKVTYGRIDPEEDWDLADEADLVFRRAHIRPKGEVGWVARIGDKIVGAVSMHHDSEHYGFDTAVLPYVQGLGIGKGLMQRGIAAFRQDNYDELGLQMRLSVINPRARRYLERLGFDCDKVAHRYWICERGS